jgi:hypothetical protein
LIKVTTAEVEAATELVIDPGHLTPLGNDTAISDPVLFMRTSIILTLSTVCENVNADVAVKFFLKIL